MAARFTLLTLAQWLVLFEFCSDFANANLTVHPTDAVVLVNHSSYFNCSTSARNMGANCVLWYHYPLNSAQRNDVYDEGQIMYEYKGRFRIETDLSAGVFNLVVERPSLADAGRYECQDGIGQGDKASAELIVLDGNPSCESNMNPDGVFGQNDCGLEPDEVQLTCNVTSFHGNISPTLEWKISGDKSSSSLSVCEHSTSCSLTLKGNLTFDNQSLVCQTTKATRQQYGCSIGPMKVKYALSSRLKLATDGDVQCYANTSLSCSYKWYNAKDEEVSPDENLGKQDLGQYKCEAQCEVNQHNKSCKFTAMEVDVVPPGPDALLALLSIAMFFAIAALVIICLYKKKCSQVFKKPGSDTLPSQLEPLVAISLPSITDQGMVDTLAINQYFMDRGTSGAIYGPFRWKDKKCALKQILFSPDKLTTERKEEIMQLSNRCRELDHPHLCKIFEVWFPSLALYIVMEYAEARSLDKIIRPKDASSSLILFPPEIVRNWALQIADGMRHLHYKDLVHRNLKAAHVLVMESPNVSPNTLKIGSYTLMKEHDHATVMSVKGTLAWMAPEYIRGEPFSKASDVWSYGVTVWEILTRDVPYSEVKKETDIVRQAINKTLQLKIPDACPEPLQDLLRKCWNYEVDKRPSFTEICDHLRSRSAVWVQ